MRFYALFGAIIILISIFAVTFFLSSDKKSTHEENPIIVEDAIWSWWTRPIAVSYDNSAYFTSVTQDGSLQVSKINAGNIQKTTIDQFKPDDHNAPSILASESKPLIIFYSDHHNINEIYYKTLDADTLDAGDRKKITFSDKVTYTQLLTHKDKVVLLTRSDVCKWDYVISEDWAQSWSEPRTLLDACNIGGQTYIYTSPSTEDGIYHMAAYGHPHFSSWDDIEYAKIDIKSGNVEAGGETTHNLYDDSPPITPGDIEMVRKKGEKPNNHNVRLLEIGETNNGPVIFYATWGDTNENTSYRYSYKESGEWHESPTSIAAGFSFGRPEVNYTGGVSINNNEVILSRKNGANYVIERHILDQDNILTLQEISKESSNPLARPIHVVNSNTYMFQQLLNYDSFHRYSSNAVIMGTR